MFKNFFEFISLKSKIFIVLIISLYTQNIIAQNMDSMDIMSYELSVDLTKFKTKKLAAVAEIECQSSKGYFPKSAIFMLLKLKVDSILYRNSDSINYTKTNFSYNDTFIKINRKLDKPTFYKIFYQGSPIKDAQWGGFYFSGEYAYNLGVGFASNPHNYGRVWFPCIDNFTDKAIFKYFVKVPRGYTAVCGGILLDTIQNIDNSTTFHWEHSKSIPSYLASVAVAPYKLMKDQFIGINNSIPIMLSAELKDTFKLSKSFVNLKKALEAFELFYGPYRFERVGYSLVPFDAGAMEHACNIAYPQYAADGTTAYETLMAHELSHHWWGNNVTCKQAHDMWINEGWANYSEALFTEYIYGKLAYQNYINSIHKSVLQFAHLIDGAATAVNNVSSNNTYGRHVYRKGADMIHSIRGVMGDDEFKKKCKSLMEKYQMSNLNTQDLSDHFNIPNNFLNQMIADTGFAHFSIYDYGSKLESGSWTTSLNYKQKKRFGHHVYNNIPYEISVFDKNFHQQIFKNNLGSASTINFSTNFKPEFICFDYDQKFSDAITDDVIITDSIGKFDFKYSMILLDITQNFDTSLIRVEHNWVYPDAYFLTIPNVIISKERYWTIDGIFDNSFKASATINYDGSRISNFSAGWLDNQLLENRAEDSIILLYRANASSYWKIENNCVKTIGGKADKKGSFKINELQKGQYTFGVMGKPISSGLILPEKSKLNIYPNPATETLKIVWANELKPKRIEIFNKLGTSIKVIEVKPNTSIETLDSKSFSAGNYFASITYDDDQISSHIFIIVR